jgi:hypothetical protein
MSEVIFQAWDAGQRKLAAGEYVAARELLAGAEAAAFAERDAAALARIHLPLLEARRQIRYLAAEGRIDIAEGSMEMRGEGGAAERLLIVRQGAEARVATPGAAGFEVGLRIEWTTSEDAVIGASTERDLVVPLPTAGVYDGRRGLGAVARESILIAWEALALKWQRLNPPSPPSPLHPPAGDGWAEVAWLRRALEVDPACEPVAMRLMAVAEGIERMGKG